MRGIWQILTLTLIAWTSALPAGVVGTGLRGGSALENIAGVAVFALPFCFLPLLLGLVVYFLARKSIGNAMPIGIGVIIGASVLAFAFIAKAMS